MYKNGLKSYVFIFWESLILFIFNQNKWFQILFVFKNRLILLAYN